MLHTFPDAGEFEHRMQETELDYLAGSVGSTDGDGRELHRPALLIAASRPATVISMGDYDEGMRIRTEVLGREHVARSTANATDLDRAWLEWITTNVWGDLWANPTLDRKTRSMITIAILAALGRDELTLHLEASATTGVSDAELAQVLQHVAVYAGVPAANHAYPSCPIGAAGMTATLTYAPRAHERSSAVLVLRLSIDGEAGSRARPDRDRSNTHRNHGSGSGLGGAQ